jgi:uncharacterized DUF497 family protein
VTKQGRHLFICFTLRGSGIRVISSREMSKKEGKLYVELCEEWKGLWKKLLFWG